VVVADHLFLYFFEVVVVAHLFEVVVAHLFEVVVAAHLFEGVVAIVPDPCQSQVQQHCHL
jgi:hypothetical protein